MSSRDLKNLADSEGYNAQPPQPSSSMNSGRRTQTAGRVRDEDPAAGQFYDQQIRPKKKEFNLLAVKMDANYVRIEAFDNAFKDKEPELPTPHELQELKKLIEENKSLAERKLRILEGSDGNIGLNECIQLLKNAKNGTKDQQPQRTTSKRGNNNSARPGLGGELDGAADSAASSPAIDGKPRNPRPQKMSSQPPKKETSVKREDSEVPDVPVKTGKVVFALDAEVAFKPKPANGSEESDWILGKVVKVIGEGKSRRYDVQDPVPDDKTGQQAIVRTGSSSMVTIPPLGAPLPEYPIGKHVLARYPDTTTFYKAEVAGNIGTQVMLKFDGEEDQEKTMNVDRRFVLDHRG